MFLEKPVFRPLEARLPSTRRSLVTWPPTPSNSPLVPIAVLLLIFKLLRLIIATFPSLVPVSCIILVPSLFYFSDLM